MDKGQLASDKLRLLTTDKLGLLIPDDELKRILKEDTEKEDSEFNAYCEDDTPFRRNARLWQSRWRKEELNRQKLEDRMGYYIPPKGKRKGEQIYLGNLLFDDDAKNGLNFYRKYFGILAEVEDKYKFKKSNDKEPNEIYQNLLCSGHIPFNMFIPLDQDRDYFKNIFNDILGENIKENKKIKRIVKFKIEYKPTPKEEYLDDDTAFDAYIEYINRDNERCIIGIEVKYTETSYSLGKKSAQRNKAWTDSSKYYIITNNSPAFKEKPYTKDSLLKKDEYRQIWRNQILGESILQSKLPKDKDKNFLKDNFISITIYPKGNKHFTTVGDDYKKKFLEEEFKYRCLFFTYEELFKLFKTHCQNMEAPEKERYEEWIRWMEKRYLVNFKDDPL